MIGLEKCKKIIITLINKIINIIFPNRCVVCKKTLSENEFLCSDCKKKFSIIKEPFCKKCGKKIDSFQDLYCYDCVKKHHFFNEGRALFEYSNEIKKIIFDLKYKNKRTNGNFLGSCIAYNLKSVIKYWNVDCIMPVPLYKGKKRIRGFNQSAIIAKEISIKLNIPYIENGIIRVANTIPQKELSDVKRKENLHKAFIMNKNNIDIIGKYKNILLIDDIYTTGSTIDECSRIIKNSTRANVYFITASIGHGV